MQPLGCPGGRCRREHGDDSGGGVTGMGTLAPVYMLNCPDSPVKNNVGGRGGRAGRGGSGGIGSPNGRSGNDGHSGRDGWSGPVGEGWNHHGDVRSPSPIFPGCDPPRQPERTSPRHSRKNQWPPSGEPSQPLRRLASLRHDPSSRCGTRRPRWSLRSRAGH